MLTIVEREYCQSFCVKREESPCFIFYFVSFFFFCFCFYLYVYDVKVIRKRTISWFRGAIWMCVYDKIREFQNITRCATMVNTFIVRGYVNYCRPSIIKLYDPKRIQITCSRSSPSPRFRSDYLFFLPPPSLYHTHPLCSFDWFFFLYIFFVLHRFLYFFCARLPCLIL